MTFLHRVHSRCKVNVNHREKPESKNNYSDKIIVPSSCHFSHKLLEDNYNYKGLAMELITFSRITCNYTVFIFNYLLCAAVKFLNSI